MTESSKEHSDAESDLESRGTDHQTKETFAVETNYGIIDSVPMTPWKDLVPYWEGLCRAIFEVLIENDFHPYTATLKRPRGFVASKSYWDTSHRNRKKVPLTEARYFVYKLKEKPEFVDAITRFNRSSGKSWLDESNIAVLGGYLYSFCATLMPILKVVKKGNMYCLKPVFSTHSQGHAV